jgi:serine/threonine-protein kinase
MPDPVQTHGTNAPTPATEATDLTGRTLGGFQVIRRLGAGGMGQVYLAKQLSLKRLVALKLLRSDLSTNPTALKRFEAEAHMVAKLNHPSIVQVYEFGEHDGLRYMALEYVEGRNLREHLARKGPPDLPVALSIMRQVATALQKAHDQGLVHRDIKPENILITRKVEVKVTDFGLSRFFAGGEALNLTQSGVTLGTPLYLSPEQAQGHALDHRSDLYSFGVTCYHLLAGEPPFRGVSAVEVALKHVTDQPHPLAELRPDLPPDLCVIVHKMMAKSVEDRYQTARDVLRDLARVKEGLNLGQTQMGPLGATSVLAAGMPAKTVANAGPAGAVTTALSATGGVVVGGLPIRWGRWVLAGLAVLLGGVAGAVGYIGLHPTAESSSTTVPPVPTAAMGLPEFRPVGKLTTTRERELLAILADRGVTEETRVEAGIGLGLLLLQEGRLDEARDRFEAMEKVRPEKPGSAVQVHLAGRIGKAIVLAYRDGDPQYPQAAQTSVKQFNETLTQLPATPSKGSKVDKIDRSQIVRWFVIRHPDLAQAMCDALNRDAANIAPEKLPPPLESLRSPRWPLKKE